MKKFKVNLTHKMILLDAIRVYHFRFAEVVLVDVNVAKRLKKMYVFPEASFLCRTFCL